MRHHRILIPALLGALLLPTMAAGQTTRQQVDTTFAFDRGGYVHLSLVSGEIIVTTGTTNTIRILATTDRGRLQTSFSRSEVSIEVRSVNGRISGTRYEVQVPPGTRVDAGAVSGDISISGTGGEVEANTTSGDITVENATEDVEIGTVSGTVFVRRVSGRVEAGSVSGDIDVEDITGDFESNSVSGDITVRAGKLRSFRASTTSGDLSYVGTIDASGDYRLNTHSGEVMLTLPANGSAALTLETWSGNISSDFPLTLQPSENMGGHRNRRMQFNIGTGGARISAETFSGDITIRRASPRGTEN
jgi:DUF4097 and DUF4098 domain-containing protein YvlB